MTIITPSNWLANLVKKSFLKDYPVEVHYNTIDTSVFKPTPSDFRKKNDLEDRIIVLGVASVWDKRKGLDDFIKLSQMLDEKYVIVLVGLTKKQIRKLPQNIFGISKTDSTRELVEIYSSADLFVNPTKEDNFPTVNIESMACGTPVLTYRTGGSPELIDDSCGSVVECGNIDQLKKEVERICETNPFSHVSCIQKVKLLEISNTVNPANFENDN